MPRPAASPGYLAEVEASHLAGQALPGAVVVHMKRDIEGESRSGRPPRRMFIELTLSEAVQHWRHVGELIRQAGAMSRQPSRADAAPNL